MLACESDCCDYIRNVSAARNRPWPAIDHSIIQLARRIVALIVGLNQLAAQTFSNRLKIFVSHHFISSFGPVRTYYPTQNTEAWISPKPFLAPGGFSLIGVNVLVNPEEVLWIVFSLNLQ
jgi:hypothetical protein